MQFQKQKQRTKGSAKSERLRCPVFPPHFRRFILAVACWRLGCVALLRPRQPRLASRLDRSHKACATCVAHRFRAVAAADIVRRRSSSSWCVSGGIKTTLAHPRGSRPDRRDRDAVRQKPDVRVHPRVSLRGVDRHACDHARRRGSGERYARAAAAAPGRHRV